MIAKNTTDTKQVRCQTISFASFAFFVVIVNAPKAPSQRTRPKVRRATRIAMPGRRSAPRKAAKNESIRIE